MKPVYQRVLLKISGEALMGSRAFGIDPAMVRYIAGEIRGVNRLGVQLGVVVGGGNIFRGIESGSRGIERATADHMGMLATVINSLALQGALEGIGVDSRVQSAIEMRQVAEPYIRRRAVRHLEKGRVVIFAAGTGNPYFTTDSAAALRAAEIGADVIFKATQVDGVYTGDPKKDPKARLIKDITYMKAIERRLRFMDTSALSLCMENNIPILVFDLHKPGNIKRAVGGERVGTLIVND